MFPYIVFGVCAGAWALAFIASFVAAELDHRRRWRQGRQVELFDNDEARMQALLAAGAPLDVAEQILRGNKINAIRALRDQTGLGLKETKDVVELYQDALYRYEPHTQPWRPWRIP